jgi:phenylpyruvate tautomerase PptA (4-oxalocrotonate tautomerase family)
VPLARIDLPSGKGPAYRGAISDTIYQAMISVLNVPKDDRFQVIVEHGPNELVIDPDYLRIHRTADAIIIQITLNEGRTTEMKKNFYKAVVDGLHQQVGLRREDIVINLVEVKKENWSFGNGEAQYAL